MPLTGPVKDMVKRWIQSAMPLTGPVKDMVERGIQTAMPLTGPVKDMVKRGIQTAMPLTGPVKERAEVSILILFLASATCSSSQTNGETEKKEKLGERDLSEKGRICKFPSSTIKVTM